MALMRIYYGITARGDTECLVWEERTIAHGTILEWRMMQMTFGTLSSSDGSEGVGCMPPEEWMNWIVKPNYSLVSTAICAECEGPSFSDYLCARCRSNG